ncbi:MAG TPA: HU family DNA-binding protein [Phycisphaerae bacterium]|nr:HU family DNA-binding protein [Phycisphaerae bacterium]HRW55658.1 HU family DNA-binding protein [Phycisphaerae bacterium]
MAAKAMSKTALIRHLAEKNDMTRAQVVDFMDSLCATAYKEAKNGFTLPGLGKLVLQHRKARMGRNPATGETIKIAAKKVVKFRVAKACKDAILGTAGAKKTTKKKTTKKKVSKKR